MSLPFKSTINLYCRQYFSKTRYDSVYLFYNFLIFIYSYIIKVYFTDRAVNVELIHQDDGFFLNYDKIQVKVHTKPCTRLHENLSLIFKILPENIKSY